MSPGGGGEWGECIVGECIIIVKNPGVERGGGIDKF